MSINNISINEKISDFMWISEYHRFDNNSRKVFYYENDKKTIKNIVNYDNILVKIDIYEARVQTWFFNIAQDILNNQKGAGDYIILMIAFSYIDGIERFRQGKQPGKNESKAIWFKSSVRKIFKECNLSEEIINNLWKDARCGLFHAGFTEKKTSISLYYNEPFKMDEDDEYLVINPNLLFEFIFKDFEEYIISLRNENNNELRENFETLWDYLWENS